MVEPVVADQRERLANIRSFAQLIAYLRNELDWPIGSDDFDNLTFEYAPDELGIDARNAAKIQEIRRLRPLVPSQPWGIFFVKFEPKRLPVVALRRILGKVTLKKRGSTNPSDRQGWAADDLLFVSNYGEANERRIALAHFAKPERNRDLPTLKVLGWDNLDTPLHLDSVAHAFNQHLAWPENDRDSDAWREQWRGAFTLRHGEVITTSKQLSKRLAALARAIRDRIRTALAVENEDGPLTQLLTTFQAALINDLGESSFADMYAQTIAYGLLSARITNPKRRNADDLVDHMRTNPFLKELLETFLHVGGRRRPSGGLDIDFDELGVSEVVELLDQADIEAVVRDFGDRNPREDPVIHFYEDFLADYDKEQKVRRGIFYTPRPVVSYIVRSVDEMLRTEFGLPDGLADTTCWADMLEHRDDLSIPEGTSPDHAFVQILDPAVGTGTFLVEVIDLIHQTMVEKWSSRGQNETQRRELWNDYVPKHLLPRLHGFELLMAPYAIAHLKVGLKLFETGYRFEGAHRARVYLTNSLEPPDREQRSLGMLPALAREAEAVNEIKRNQRFTVVIGNPPYLGEAGRGGDWIAALMRGCEFSHGRSTASYFEVAGERLRERNPKWLNDLYVQFTRLSQWLLEQSGAGVHGFITNHSYLDNPTFRGMRWALRDFFDKLSVLDLHGNLKKKEQAPDGRKDENVFEIEQGVSIGFFLKSDSKNRPAIVSHADCWGARSGKYEWLIGHSTIDTDWAEVVPREKFFLLKPISDVGVREYDRWHSVIDIFPVNSVGIVTARDGLTVQRSANSVWQVVSEVAHGQPDEIRRKYNLRQDVRDWKVKEAQKDLRRAGPCRHDIVPMLYRPFDTRFTYYTGRSRGFLCRPRAHVMRHILGRNNIALLTCRQHARGDSEWAQVFVSQFITESCAISNVTREINYVFPAYLYPGVGDADGLIFSNWPAGKDGRMPNLDSGFVSQIASATGLRFECEGRGDLRRSFAAEDVLAWVYAVFHSPCYRARYGDQLKLDFPRVPQPKSLEIFGALVGHGQQLLETHLLDSSNRAKTTSQYMGPSSPKVSKVGWSEDTVWLDAGRTNARDSHRATEPGTAGFSGVPEEVWHLQIGGYQVCHKWLKDRAGRVLSDEEIGQYQDIVFALSETIRIANEIDEAIESCGGWPDAFHAAVPTSVAKAH